MGRWFEVCSWNSTALLDLEECHVSVVNLGVAALSTSVALFTSFYFCCHSPKWKRRSLVEDVLWLLLMLVNVADLGEALLSSSRAITSILVPASSIIMTAAWVDALPLNPVGACLCWAISSSCQALRLAQLLNMHLGPQHVRLLSAASSTILSVALAFAVLRRIGWQQKELKEPLTDDHSEISYRHAEACLFSKATFFWLTPLLFTGFKTPLEMEHLGQLSEKESTKYQLLRFKSIYTSEKGLSLWQCYFRSCWGPFALGGLYKLMGDLVGMVGPLGLSVVIDFVYKQEDAVENPTVVQFLNNGYIMGCIVFLSALAQGTLSQGSTHLVNVQGIHLKSSLQALVYDKALRLCIWNINEHQEEDENALGKESNGLHNEKVASESKSAIDMGTITNLMSEDAYNVMSFFWIGHYIWAIPLKIGVLMYLLYRKLEIYAVIGAAFCILTMTPLQFLIGKNMSSNSKKITDASDERLRQINEVLQGIRLLKLYGWECLYGDRVRKTRSVELKLLDKDSLYWALMTFLTHASSVMVTLVTFGAYWLVESAPLSAGKVFSGLALFNQLTVPLFIFPITVPIIINAIVSTRRLEHFLNLPEIKSEIPAKTESTNTVENENATKQIISLYENSAITKNKDKRLENESIPKNRVERADSVFGLGDILEHDAEDDKEQGSDVEDYIEEEEPVTPLDTRTDITVRVKGGKFSWNGDKPVLQLSDVSIPAGKLTVIVGQVGSGKTSCLSALLGEMNKINGEVYWTKDSVIAYATQKPWLLNATLRENVLFGQPFRPRRYNRVIAACSLQPDIDILPGKDFTEIGEKGINLSGGQKQRVAVARALYSLANVVILDDPLSALDYEVGQKLFNDGIRKMLLRGQKRTVILVTHQLQLLPFAHKIIALEGGLVRAQGSLCEIESSDSELVRSWRAAMSREALEEKKNTAARERWQLLKLVSRIGLQLKQRNITDGTWQTDEEAHVAPPAFLPLRRRRGTFSGSRYFTHDLPLPTDECEEEFLERNKDRTASISGGRFSLRFRGRAATATDCGGPAHHQHCLISRACSLQARHTTANVCMSPSPSYPYPILRQFSSPTMQPSSHVDSCRSRALTPLENSVQQGSLLRRLFSVHSQRSMGGTIEASSNPVPEKNLLKRLMSTASNKSNSSPAMMMSDREQLQRLPSTTSAASDDFLDDDEPYEEVTDAHIGRLITDEEREYGKIPKRIYLKYLVACSPLIGCSYLASAVAWQGLRVYTDYCLSRWTESYNASDEYRGNQEEASNKQEVEYYMMVYGILSVASILLSLSSNGIGQYAGARARKCLHDQMLHNILRCPVHFFESTPIGRILNRFSTDMGVIDKKIATSIQRLLQFLLLCFSAIVVNAAVTPWFLAIAVPICVIYFIVQRFYRCSSRELQRLDSITRSPIFSHFSETLEGLTTIRAFGHQKRFADNMFRKIDAHTNTFLIMNTSNRWLGIALDYLGGVIVLVSVVAALLTAHHFPHLVTPALIGLAVNYTLLVPIYLNWVVKFLSDMEMYMGAVERVQQYAMHPTEDYRLNGVTVSKAWPEKGLIEFKGVSLRYDASREPVITGLDLRIPPGQKVGICGRTGSGKSSLVLSLFYMVDVFEGKILIDNVDTKLVPLQVLRSRLSVIPQEVIMFSGTIRENLDPQSRYSDAKLWKSLELAQLKELVSSLPGSLEAEVREGGGNLSAGQRQLFCLARAILHDAACLIMDEATSSVDPGTEKALLEAATRAFAGKTVITIAHRLPTILSCDRIIVLESGKIVEDGSPAQLCNRSMGIFSSMLRASEGGTEPRTGEQNVSETNK